MKRFFYGICLILLACLLNGCETASRLDLSQGYGDELKLVHLSAGSGEELERIREFQAALQDAEPLEKDASLFAYYPDFILDISTPESSGNFRAVVDINGDFVDFYYVGQEDALYRAGISAEDFLTLVHTS